MNFLPCYLEAVLIGLNESAIKNAAINHSDVPLDKQPLSFMTVVAYLVLVKTVSLEQVLCAAVYIIIHQ